MARSVSAGYLADAIMDSLREYSGLAVDEMKEAVRAAGNTVRDEIRENAPKDTGTYAKSWTVKRQRQSWPGKTWPAWERRQAEPWLCTQTGKSCRSCL